MTQYLFQTSEFGISDKGMHLLRNGFNYQTIRWAEINSIRIEKGKELHNWTIVFLVGMVILTVGTYLSGIIINTLLYEEIGSAYRMMLLFFIPCLGAHFVYSSLQTGIILRVNYSTNKNDKFPLKEIIRAHRLSEFKLLMKDKLNIKLNKLVKL